MRKKVFVLEDDEDIRAIIAYILIEEQIDVRSYSRAEEFMADAIKADADLFLLDIMVPDADGVDISKQLKSNSQTSHIPIILISAHYNQNASNMEHIADFINKPFDIYDLLYSIQRHLH